MATNSCGKRQQPLTFRDGGGGGDRARRKTRRSKDQGRRRERRQRRCPGCLAPLPAPADPPRTSRPQNRAGPWPSSPQRGSRAPPLTPRPPPPPHRPRAAGARRSPARGQARPPAPSRRPSGIVVLHICFRKKVPVILISPWVHASPEQRIRIRSIYHQLAKMNVVKRIMGRPRQEECSPQDNALGLMHLRRLFTELCHPPWHMTQKEQEEKLYMMLPVFNRVFGNAPPNTMTEKFSDLLQFTTQVSQLMVTEI
ncbi:uncharacterized protein LOC144257169 [Urocitellus parryii]